MNETENEIKDKIAAHGWTYNAVSRFLVVTNTTPYKLAQICGVEKSVVSRWLHSATLPAFVQWSFVAFEKLRLSGSNVLDFF